MIEEHQRLLRAMLEARNKYEAATEAHRVAWKAYLDAQSEFTGKFAESDHPLGPFVVGTVLVEHEPDGRPWPPHGEVFKYREVIRCHTSD